ncbi:hypothetical protein JCM10212_002204 [Sporobolomyces blumeae]
MTTTTLKLVRYDSINREGKVKTVFVDSFSEKPVYFAKTERTSALEANRTVLFDTRKPIAVGAVSLDWIQLGNERATKATNFFRRPNFLSEKQVWTTAEGIDVRWKTLQDGTLVLVAHKTKQQLVTVNLQSSAASTTPQLTITINTHLLSPSSSTLAPPLDYSKRFSTLVPSKKKISKKPDHSPTSTSTSTSTAARCPSATSQTSCSTIDLVILSLVHQDYVRADSNRLKQAEADERSNEWEVSV